MNVKITAALRGALEATGLDVDEFIAQFAEWKAGDEYGSRWFGKDGAYARPKVNGEYALRHVLLIPMTDLEQLKKWDKVYQRGGRKTSDRVLVYASASSTHHLLIFILNEPDAHNIAEMRTREHFEVMNGFAAIAEEFIDTGNVLG
jgi:mRNA interferase YafO